MEQIQLFQISPKELKEAILKGVDERLEKLTSSILFYDKDELLTRQEAADYLKIDLSTLWKWTKESKLLSYGINGRVYYRLSEIDEALIPLNSPYGNKNPHKSMTVGKTVSKNSIQ